MRTENGRFYELLERYKNDATACECWNGRRHTVDNCPTGIRALDGSVQDLHEV